MNNRGYYSDSYTTEFSARVVALEQDGDGCQVVLDQTYFYPTSGGQPYDKGTIEGIAVLDVRVRREDGAIVHVLAAATEAEAVSGVIDWERRFDHMQQHTGQHILSQAFMRIADAQTVGFHLSDDTVTLDLDKEKMSKSDVEEAEKLANKVVWQNRPVVVRWATRSEAEGLALRKIPPNGDDKLRLIDILGFDLTACGGTHVARTGEVGLIKVVKQELRNKKTRIHFVCGGRALAHHGAANEVIQQLTAQLTTGQEDLSASVKKLQEGEKEAHRTLKRLQNELDKIEAQQLRQKARQIGDTALVVHVFRGAPVAKIRGLASSLTKEPGVIALLGSVGERTHLVFSRSADAPGSMKMLLQLAFEELGDGSGGGSDGHAQGAGPAANVESVEQAIQRAAGEALEELDTLG